MLNITIIFIYLFYYISSINSNNQCDLLNAIDLQIVTYKHSLIIRVEPIEFSEEIENHILIRKVLIRELIKLPLNNHQQIKVNDMIIIRIDKYIERILGNSCWDLLRITNVDLILFLNQTNTNEFDLQYPPVESTYRVRQNIDAVINYETYAPQVIIKTQISKAILSKNYSLQCNARGNPLPRLFWSKNNQTMEYYSTTKQCKTSCRIYSIQNKYQSILYFQSITDTDSGIYFCHAENPLNHTMVSVHLNVFNTNETNMNLTCNSLKFCHDNGQCIMIDNQLKCLCNNQYFGEQCQMNYDDIIKKQNNIILLFKSRFLAGCILFLITFILLLIIFISCILSKTHRIKQEKNSLSKSMITNGKTEQNNQQSYSSPTVQIIPKTNHLILSESDLI